VNNLLNTPAASTVKNEAHATPQGDRLLTAAEVTAALGLRCKTAHTALSLARRGLIEAVRLNARVVRFRASSVERLIASK
jgi:predicted DNA-binding transcriptional regulator AlpA